MINFKHILALSMTAALAANASAADSTVTISGSITKPTCTISVDQTDVDLGKVSATSFKQGEAKLSSHFISGEGSLFSITVTDADAIKAGNEGAACQSISMLSGDSSNGLPQITVTADAATTNGLLKSKTADENSNLGILVVDSAGQPVDFSENTSVVLELEDKEAGKMSFKAYFAAISKTDKIQEQDISAALTFNVGYK